MKKIILSILSLLWAFTSSAQTVTATHTYDALNRLTVTTYSNGTSISYQYDALGNRTTKTIVGVSCPLPIANFGSTNNLLNVNFSNTSSNALSYNWDFGNGQTSTQINPTVTYATAGTYNVCLIATNTCGADTICTSVTVSNCTNPISSFTYVVTGNTITLSNTSTNGISYTWNFGDGQTSTQTSPSHTYASNGTYYVCLTATNACSSVQSCQTITIQNTQVGNGCWKMVSAGLYHASALKEDGTIWCWGRNANGELGDGTNTNKNYPVQVGTSNQWKDVKCGGMQTLAIKNDGTLWAWGRNDYGQLGIGTTINSNIPIQVGTDTTWVELGTGSNSSGAIKRDGTLWMWGYNGNYELGDGTIINKLIPTQIGTEKRWNKISNKGGTHKHAIKTDGTLWGWGTNMVGELGNGTLSGSAIPTKIGMDTTWIAIQSSTIFSAGIKMNKKISLWGDNTYGQLGNGNNTNQLTPTEISSLSNILRLGLGREHAMCIGASGTIYSWGRNNNYQVGNGTQFNTNAPTSLGGAVIGWRQASGGYAFSVALDGGEIYTWGDNSYGQLGDSSYSTKTVPYKIASNCSCPLPEVDFAYIQDSLQFEFVNLSQYATNYIWAFGNGQTSTVNSPVNQLNNYTTAGSYQVCLSATNLCGTKQYCRQVNIEPANCNLTVTGYNGVSPSCVPGADGTASFTTSGGTAPYTYAINNGGIITPQTGAANSLVSGVLYTITVTDALGCTKTSTVQLFAPTASPLSVASVPISATICNGASISLTATGANNYSWSGGITNGISFSPTTTTTYTVTGTDLNGCTVTATKLVTVNSLPAVNITVTPNDTVCAGTPITLTASGGSTYSWTGGITNGTAFAPTASGTYTVTVTGANGCTNTQTQNVVVNTLPTISVTATPNDTVCAGTPITLTASGGSTYSWTGGITNGTAFTPTSSGTYTVTVTGANGCTKTQTQSVVVNTLPTISVTATPNDTVCSGIPITLSANGGTSYSWTGGITNGTAFTPTSSGTYTITVTGANGCTKTQTQNVVVNPLPTISISAAPNDTVCAGTPITLTANGGAIYSWTGGITNGTAFAPTASGTYTVTVTGANGCTKTQTQSVVVNPLPTISISATPNDTVCTGTPITLTANGGAIYSWTGGITNSTAFTPTSGGTYTVTVTGANGCTNTQTQNIVVNPLPTISISAVPNDTVCAGTPITLTANGGSSYSWSGGITNGTAFTPTSSGTYTVSVTGANGCTNTQTQNIVVNPLPTISISTLPNDTVCLGTPITLTASGGSTYSWTGGITNGTVFTPTSNGTYTVTVTGANGCTITQMQSVLVNPLPTISISATPNDTVCSGTPITLTANGGAIYSWTGGVTNGTAFTPTLSGIYSVTVIDSNGCNQTAARSITVNLLPSVQANITPNDTICLGTPVTLFGLGAITYSWNWGVINNMPFAPSVSATYFLTGLDSNNCVGTDSIQLVVNPNLIPTISISSNPIQGATNDPIVYTAITNVPLPYNIEWYRNNSLSITGTSNIWADNIIAGANSVYAVIKSPNQCLSPDSAKSNQLEVLNITGVHNILPEGFLVYPNPTEDKLTIDGLQFGDEFMIYDAIGKAIFSRKADKNIVQLDVSYFAHGIYHIHFSRNQFKWVVKFVKL